MFLRICCILQYPLAAEARFHVSQSDLTTKIQMLKSILGNAEIREAVTARKYVTVRLNYTSVSGDSDDIPGIGQYDDFHTIDWQRDIARDRMRHRHIIKKKQDSVCDLIKGAHDAWSGWVCVLLVGLVTGVVAGVIDIGASWMSDLKFGICPEAFWLNREQCCWSSNETTFDKGNCSQVRPYVMVSMKSCQSSGIFWAL